MRRVPFIEGPRCIPGADMPADLRVLIAKERSKTRSRCKHPRPPASVKWVTLINKERHLPLATPDDAIDGHHVLLVGASIRAAAQSAKKAGFLVTGIDRFGDFDTRQICDRFTTFRELTALSPVEFDDWVRQCPGNQFLQVGGVSEDGADVITQLAKSRRLLGISAAMQREMACPKWLRETAESSRITFPESYTADESNPSFRAVSDGRIQKRWLRKKVWQDGPSCGGLGVRWANSGLGTSFVSRNSLELTNPSIPELWQRWTEGRSYGASFYSDGESACLLGVCRSSIHRIGNRPFVYAGSYGPLTIHSSINNRLSELGQAIVRRSKIAGLFGVDVIIDRCDRVTLLEINPRWTASIELIERDWLHRGCAVPMGSLVGSVLRSVPTEEIRSTVGKHAGALRQFGRDTSWKRIVYATRAGQFCHESLPLRSAQLLEPFRFGGLQIQIADVPNDGQIIAKHDPILTLIIRVPGKTLPKESFSWHKARKVIWAIQESIYSPRSSANE